MKVSRRALFASPTSLGPLRAAVSRSATGGKSPYTGLDITFAELDAGQRGAPSGFAVPAGYDIAVLFLTNPLRAEGQAEPGFDLLMQSIDGGTAAPDAELVPLGLMRRHVAEVIATCAGLPLNSLASAKAIRRICVGPAAPEAPAANLAEAAKGMAFIQLKLWLLLQQGLSAFCRANGIAFIGNPQGSRTPAGFLRHNCAGRDNVLYGELVLAQIVRAVSGAQEELPVLLPNESSAVQSISA